MRIGEDDDGGHDSHAHGRHAGIRCDARWHRAWAAVVVVHDFAGMSQDLRNQADWLASEGFLAAAPDMYYFGTRLRCLWTMVRNLSAGQGRTFDDLDAVRGWLSERPDCTGNVGVVGFCMGGGYALALAPGCQAPRELRTGGR